MYLLSIFGAGQPPLYAGLVWTVIRSAYREFPGSSPEVLPQDSFMGVLRESSFCRHDCCVFAHSRPAAVSYPVKIRDKSDRRLTARTDERLILIMRRKIWVVSDFVVISFRSPRVRAKILTLKYPFCSKFGSPSPPTLKDYCGSNPREGNTMSLSNERSSPLTETFIDGCERTIKIPQWGIIYLKEIISRDSQAERQQALNLWLRRFDSGSLCQCIFAHKALPLHLSETGGRKALNDESGRRPVSNYLIWGI